MSAFERETDSEKLVMSFDGDPIDAQPGDTIAAALLNAARLMTSRSPKFRRPRGPFCLNGDCGTCLVRVDGQPNVRACMTPARDGMEVQAQNTFRPKGLDPTQLVDKAFRKGFDHHHFMVKPKIANDVMQSVARELAGFGDLPDAPWKGEVEHRHHEPAALIIGRGSAGRAASEVLREAGVDSLVVDRHELDVPAEGETCLSNTGIFAAYPGEALWAGTGPGAAGTSTGSETTVLHTFRPRHVLIATGARESMVPFPNNDVPGVVGARGLQRMLARSKARLAVECVVVGSGALAKEYATAFDCRAVSPEDVASVLGGRHVEGVRLRDGSTLRCKLVAVASTPSPASELAAQAGATVSWNGSGYAVVRDKSGRAGRIGNTQIWAAGDVAQWVGAEEAAGDGARVAAQIARSILELAPTEVPRNHV